MPNPPPLRTALIRPPPPPTLRPSLPLVDPGRAGTGPRRSGTGPGSMSGAPVVVPVVWGRFRRRSIWFSASRLPPGRGPDPPLPGVPNLRPWGAGPMGHRRGLRPGGGKETTREILKTIIMSQVWDTIHRQVLRIGSRLIAPTGQPVEEEEVCAKTARACRWDSGDEERHACVAVLKTLLQYITWDEIKWIF